MLMRICLIVAIVAGLAIGTLNFLQVKEKITTLKANLEEQTQGRQKAETELASTRKDLSKTKADLKTTQETLATTTQERDTAVAEAAKKTKEAEDLSTNLKRVTEERDGAQEEVARYRATGMKPEEIVAVNKQLKDLKTSIEEKDQVIRTARNKIDNLQTELDRYKSPEKPVLLPASLKGKVLVTDPKWNFVVVNIGEEQRVKDFGQLLVNRDGKLVAKVVVRSVQKDRSIANVMPGWQLGDILEGDQVIAAYPSPEL